MTNQVETSVQWGQVDRAPGDAQRYLDLLTKLIDTLKTRSIDMMDLQPGASALEVGCGVGRDAEAMAHRVAPNGSVIAIDVSRELIVQAQERVGASLPQLRFELADAHALPYGDNSFDAVHVDRVLQHLENPQKAVSEMVRVARPEGRIVALEPDWYTMTLSAGDGRIAQMLTQQRAEIAIRNGRIGRDIPRLLRVAGCRSVAVEGALFVTQDLGTADYIFGLSGLMKGLLEAGRVTPEEANAWWTSARAQDSDGQFVGTVSALFIAGVK